MGPPRRGASSLEDDHGLESVLRVITAEGQLGKLSARLERPATAKQASQGTGFTANPYLRARPGTAAVDRRRGDPVTFFLQDTFGGESPHAIIHGAWAQSGTGEQMCSAPRQEGVQTLTPPTLPPTTAESATPRAEAPASPLTASQPRPSLQVDHSTPRPATGISPPRQQSPQPVSSARISRSRSVFTGLQPLPPSPRVAEDAGIPAQASPRAPSPSRVSLSAALGSPRTPARAASARLASVVAPGAAGVPGSSAPGAAWVPATPSASGSGPPRTVESLMEENLKLRRQLAEMQRQLTLTQTAQRRGEAEAARLRTSLARAEEMMGQREAGTLSPNSMASQLYRTPETTSLVAALRQRLEDCEAGREDLRRELERMAKSTRATAVAELQAEVQACSEETGRQLARAELLAGRTAAATAEVVELRRQLAEQAAAHAAAQVRLEEETQCLHDQPGRTGAAAGHGRHHHSSSSSGPSTLCSPPRVNRRDGPETEAVSSKVASGGGGGDSNRLAAANAAATLAELETCAEVLLSHAHLINARVPLGPAHRGSMAMLEAWVRNRGPQVAGAPAVLRTLRAHQGRLHAALVALPGGPIFTNASLAALTVLAAQAAAQPVADAPEPGQGDDGEHSNSERGQQRQQQLGKAGVEPQTPQPRAHPISRVASTRGGGTGPTQPHGQVSPTKGAAVAGHSPSLACAPPPAPPFPPQQRQPPLAVPRLKLPNAGGSSGLPWIPPSVVEEEPEEVESLDSVPTAATPAQTHAEVGSSPRAAHGVGSVGAASPIGGGAGRLPSGRVDNRSKYDVIRSRQQQHLMEPVPLSQEPGVTGGSGGEAHTAIVAARGVEAISTDDSWQELGVEEVDEDLDGDY